MVDDCHLEKKRDMPYAADWPILTIFVWRCILGLRTWWVTKNLKISQRSVTFQIIK